MTRRPTRNDPYAFETLWRQYRACRRHKRATVNALRFELNAEENLLALQRELRDHTYRPGPSICFVTEGPKPREVFAADFRDRVVHHLLVGWQEPRFEREFVADSFACRKGKGTLAASDRLTTFLRQATANGRRGAFFVHLDVASFFPSIKKDTLYELIARRHADPEIRWLTRRVLFHDPTTHYRFRSRRGRAGPTSPDYPVPARKSLFGKQNARGLPIGNLTSQFWGNVYLNELDHFVKRRLGVRWYVRYVDDLVLLAPDAASLVEWGDGIGRFLSERLGLALRADRSVPASVDGGIDFVGWRTWWNHRVPRRRTVAGLTERVAAFARSEVRPILRHRARRIAWRGPAVLALRASLASFAGHLQHGAAGAVWQRTLEAEPWLDACFVRTGWWTFRMRWPIGEPVAERTFAERHWRVVRDADDATLVFLRVGRYVEFRGPMLQRALGALGLRRVVLPRGGYRYAAGFPVALCGRFLARAVSQGLAVGLVPGRGGVRAIVARWPKSFPFQAATSTVA